MTNENQLRIDSMTKDVLARIRLELSMIDDLEKGFTFSFSGDAEAEKQKAIGKYEHQLERDLKVLKILKG